MRIAHRHKNIKDYWTKRWDDIPVDHPMQNPNIYPLKFARFTIHSKDGRILEAGCGAGRILRYYADRGHDIVGIDFVSSVIQKLKTTDPKLNVEVGDITNLQFSDQSFKYVLAFGLYHNLGHKLDKAMHETYRILQEGGRVCASFRADNVKTWLTDWMTGHRARKQGIKVPATEFHKMNLKEDEFINLFKRAGFNIEKVWSVENMPFLYKFPFFRAKAHKVFNENAARKEGYKLSLIGNVIQKSLLRCFPKQFCDVFVLIAKK